MTFDSRERSTFAGEPFELYLWQLDAQAWAQTPCDTAREFQGRIYTPEVLSRGEVDQNGEAGSGSVTVTMDLTNPVAQIFLAGAPSSPLSLIIVVGHDGESETGCAFTGRVTAAKFKEAAELTCVPRQQVWKQALPALPFQMQCPLRWGSTRCGVDRSAWRVSATLTSVSGATLQSSAFASKPSGHFTGGWIEWNGLLCMIGAHTGDLITLLKALPGLTAGAQVAAYPGCQGTEADCAGRFGNLPNHLGWSRIPAKNPFGQGGIA